MHTLGDMAKSLNRPAVQLHGLQTRFELPAFEGAAYSDAYLAFLRAVVCMPKSLSCVALCAGVRKRSRLHPEPHTLSANSASTQPSDA